MAGGGKALPPLPHLRLLSVHVTIPALHDLSFHTGIYAGPPHHHFHTLATLINASSLAATTTVLSMTLVLPAANDGWLDTFVDDAYISANHVVGTGSPLRVLEFLSRLESDLGKFVSKVPENPELSKEVRIFPWGNPRFSGASPDGRIVRSLETHLLASCWKGYGHRKVEKGVVDESRGRFARRPMGG